MPGKLDARVRDRALAECRGNPLALLELPCGRTATEPALGSADLQHSSAPLLNRLEQRFVRQLTPLRSGPAVAAGGGRRARGDLPLLWGAAERLGLGVDAATTAESAGLIELHGTIRFRHPIVRSAVYRREPGPTAQVHQALADVTNADIDPDRRAWHRAAAVAPDEAVAADLERSADRARSAGWRPPRRSSRRPRR